MRRGWVEGGAELEGRVAICSRPMLAIAGHAPTHACPTSLPPSSGTTITTMQAALASTSAFVRPATAVRVSLRAAAGPPAALDSVHYTALEWRSPPTSLGFRAAGPAQPLHQHSSQHPPALFSRLAGPSASSPVHSSVYEQRCCTPASRGRPPPVASTALPLKCRPVLISSAAPCPACVSPACAARPPVLCDRARRRLGPERRGARPPEGQGPCRK